MLGKLQALSIAMPCPARATRGLRRSRLTVFPSIQRDQDLVSHHGRRRPSWTLFAIALAFSAFLIPETAHAETCFESGDIIIESDEVRRCDLMVLPGSLLVKEGGRIVGSANVPLGSAHVLGEVTGDVAVLRDLMIEGHVSGSATAMLGNLDVEGEVSGGLTAGGDLRLDGTAGGDLSASGDIFISDAASISNSARVTAGGQVSDADGDPLPLVQIGDEPVVDTVSLLLRALAMVVFGVVFAALATAAIPDAIENTREASRRSTTLTTFLGLVAGLILLVASWLVIPAVIGLIAMAVGGVGLGERVGGRIGGERSRVVQSALGAGALSAIAALLMVFGAGNPIRLCLAVIPLVILAAAALGPGLVTQFGRRAWRPGPDSLEQDPYEVVQPDDPSVGGEEPQPLGLPISGETPWIQEGPVEPGPIEPEAGSSAPDAAPDAALGTPPLSGGDSEHDTRLPGSSGDPLESSDDTVAENVLRQLRRVPGISPIYAELLRSAGIGSLSDFATLSPQRLLEIASAPGVLPIDLETASNWLRSAGELSQAD